MAVYIHTSAGVPAASRGGFYREGRFSFAAPTLAWSYLHTHAYWVSEMALYLNATAHSLGLDNSPLSPYLRSGLSEKEAFSTQRMLLEGEATSGARRVCHFSRSASLVEHVRGTAEIGDTFYRKSMGCVPFEVVRGMPFVAVVLTSPDSSAAATAPPDGIAPVHTFFRLFASMDGVFAPTCNLGGECYCWVGGTLEGSDGCEGTQDEDDREASNAVLSAVATGAIAAVMACMAVLRRRRRYDMGRTSPAAVAGSELAVSRVKAVSYKHAHAFLASARADKEGWGAAPVKPARVAEPEAEVKAKLIDSAEAGGNARAFSPGAEMSVVKQA